MSIKSDLINDNGWTEINVHNYPPERITLTKGDRRIVLNTMMMELFRQEVMPSQMALTLWGWEFI